MLELPRTAFALSLCWVALLILSAFRLGLYFTRRSDFPELSGEQRLELFWVGLRLDGVIVSRACMLPLLAALLLPESLFTACQSIFRAYASVLYFVLFLFEIAGLYFFRYYDFRPNYLVFEHGADPEVIKTVARAYPV